MKNIKITLVVLIVLIVGAVLLFGAKKRTEAPAPVVDDQTEVVGNESGQDGELREFTVSGQNFSFTPSLITVQKGDRVKITFKNTQGFHDFKIDEFGVATKQAQSPFEEVLEFTADKIGSFEYYCSVGTHRAMGMKGVLKVE
ncbi:MAG: Plastocyanin [Candidatus Nomurabacteria bacterium GW2011_GWA2_43_15]|uniref:Plastocyanin n=2 Tax=Candidatus Nomuraibacteriota TaxID=1752729 RepID=A0A0G1DTT1_9BACT|nr:MAG: Plastocyanin [Candidatus Nomurabacteria bacterium GW2011_GWA2_43_15]KKT19249.1 MAG: Plastocyanin [Candidatus Nomurabacteria bacterium GW2011_GWB1_43_7]